MTSSALDKCTRSIFLLLFFSGTSRTQMCPLQHGLSWTTTASKANIWAPSSSSDGSKHVPCTRDLHILDDKYLQHHTLHKISSANAAMASYSLQNLTLDLGNQTYAQFRFQLKLFYSISTSFAYHSWVSHVPYLLDYNVHFFSFGNIH